MSRKNTVLTCILKLIIALVIFPLNKIHAQESIMANLSPLELQKIIAAAIENYPRVKTFKSQVNSAKIDVSTTKTSWLDPFSFQFVSRSNQSNTNAVNVTTADILNGYQFGVSLNLGGLLAKPSQVKKAKEQVKIAELNQQEYNLTLETEVKRRYYTYLQFKSSLLSTTNAFLDAESNFKVIKIKYQKAETAIEEYNSASISYNQSIIAKINAESNFLMAKVALEELTVKKLEEIK